MPTNELYAFTKSSKPGLGLTADLTASRFVICQILYLLLKVKLTASNSTGYNHLQTPVWKDAIVVVVARLEWETGWHTTVRMGSKSIIR